MLFKANFRSVMQSIEVLSHYSTYDMNYETTTYSEDFGSRGAERWALDYSNIMSVCKIMGS